MIQLLNRAWRDDLAAIATCASRSILIVAPFIKYDEAVWFCKQIRPDIEIITLANINSDAVSTSALDLEALHYLAGASPTAKIIALPNLHAKVFVADETAAIVTSGNLTRSALDRNLEYGVLIKQPDMIRTIRKDMLSFARLGSRVDADTIAELTPLGEDLRQARANLTSNATSFAKRRFNKLVYQTKLAFASAQVGNRSAHMVFGEAIQFVLSKEPQTTKVIQQEVSHLMPDLCDDDEYFFIKGERYGRVWKRRMRHAQLHLKRRGIVTYNVRTKTWELTRS